MDEVIQMKIWQGCKSLSRVELTDIEMKPFKSIFGRLLIPSVGQEKKDNLVSKTKEVWLSLEEDLDFWTLI